MNIEVVLTQDDPKLGKRGQVVKVSSGFAQNFLFPGHKALPATSGNLKKFQDEKARQDREAAERLAAARETVARIEALGTFTLEMPAGEADKLYGAVTAQDLVQALASRGIRVEKKAVHLEDPIRRLGEYTVPLKVHPEAQALLCLRIAPKR